LGCAGPNSSTGGCIGSDWQGILPITGPWHGRFHHASSLNII
jgi:hypothetical protein